MPFSPTTAPAPLPPSVATADALRAHLLGVAPPCRLERSSCAEWRARVVPAGLVDVRRAAPGIAVLPAPAWSEPELRFLVRPEVAERLRSAAAVLPSDVRLGFWEGLRPLEVQRSLWETALAFLRSARPQAPASELELEVEQYVARPDGIAPPHSTGSAVDVAAVNAFGQVLNPNDAWGKLGNEVLARALRDAGLANYTPEWWHWSYGDEEWARAYDCAPLSFASVSQFDGPGGGI